MTRQYPAFVSVVAFALGCLDLLRGVSHTLLSSYAASDVAGLDLTGPTGLDQLVLMNAFGAANFLSGAALIYLALRDRLGALLFLAVIPCAYLMAGIGLRVNGADLAGQGVFPGQYMMAAYISLCLITIFAALRTMRRQTRGALSF
jgi:hypothetical protein